MRIGIEAFKLFRKHKHGMDIVALELIQQLQRLDSYNEYFIFCFDDIDDTVINETTNFKIIRIPKITTPIAEQFILPFLVQKYKLNILHSTNNTAPLISGCRQIVTLHDIIYLENSCKLKGGTLYQQIGNFYRRIVVPITIRKAERVITVSGSEQEKILNKIPQITGRVEVIHNSFGKHFTQKPNESTLGTCVRYKLPFEGFIFIHGNTDPKKNINNVLKSLYILKQQSKLKYKVVISDIPEWRILAKIKKFKLIGLEDDLIFTNYINNFVLPDIYNRAKVFLYPSIRESFGVPILEAMACGTPVITSNCSAMPEIAGKAAILVNPLNPHEIAEAIDNILSNESLQLELSRMGLLQIKKFNWKKSAELLLNVYQSSLQTSFSPSSIQY